MGPDAGLASMQACWDCRNKELGAFLHSPLIDELRALERLSNAHHSSRAALERATPAQASGPAGAERLPQVAEHSGAVDSATGRAAVPPSQLTSTSLQKHSISAAQTMATSEGAAIWSTTGCQGCSTDRHSSSVYMCTRQSVSVSFPLLLRVPHASWQVTPRRWTQRRPMCVQRPRQPPHSRRTPPQATPRAQATPPSPPPFAAPSAWCADHRPKTLMLRPALCFSRTTKVDALGLEAGSAGGMMSLVLCR